jgi:hypothetical protein
LVAAGTGVLVAPGTGVLVAVGTGVFVAGNGVFVGRGVFVGTDVSVAVGGLWNTVDAGKRAAVTGNTATTLKAKSASTNITRGKTFIGKYLLIIQPTGLRGGSLMGHLWDSKNG